MTLRDRLLEANTTEVPGIVKDMAPYRRWVDPLLHEAYAQAEKENDPRKQLHASLALLPVDSGQVDYLYGRLLEGEPQEVVVIREALSAHKADLTERLWALAGESEERSGRTIPCGLCVGGFCSRRPALGKSRWRRGGNAGRSRSRL